MRLLNGLAFAAMGLVPLLVLAAALTEVTLPVSRIAPALLAWIATGLPFLGISLAIGYRLSSKAALGLANVLLLPMASAGGLFLPPELFPRWLAIASSSCPVGPGGTPLVGTFTGEENPLLAIVVLLTWTVFAVGLAVLAFRRDEGQRFH
ncbi:MAG: hypothetical protein M3381_09790 [Actinomycetota bacterium]|nr:hypothetical protein [Actinomycetota bacterium]MDQ3716286.1 hypothetical protein [Actinomycetota bacterium]